MIARRTWETKGPLQILSVVAGILAVFFGVRVILSTCDEKEKMISSDKPVILSEGNEKMKPE